MAITYHSGERIQGLSYLSTQQDLTTGTTDAGTNSTIRGFGNQIRSGHAIVGSTLTKVEVSFKTAGAGTATVGVWDSSNNLKLTLGTKDLSTLTGSEAYYTFDTGSVIMQADWIIGFQISGTATNTSVTVRTNGSPDVANVDSYYYHSSNGWNADGATREYNMKIHYNNGDEKPTNVQVGSRYEETDTRKMYYRMDSDYVTDKWFELGTLPYAGGRGVFGGGSDGSITNTMEYITISTPSNATDFGDLTVARTYVEAVSSITRGVFGGGYGSADENTMDYITFATPSNATDFGNLTVARHALAGVSSGTRGVFGGGNGSNVMDYITIATPSNATDFGDLTVTRQDLAGVSSDTRGVFAGGDGSNVMDYITISTPSNATDFGDLLTNLRYPADVSNGTRGVFAGGDPNSGSGNTNVIQYITIASTGNATDFGDLTVGRHAPAGVESDTRGVIGGGYSGGNSNVMDYITIATTGNATDFGDLTAATNHLGGASRF